MDRHLPLLSRLGPTCSSYEHIHCDLILPDHLYVDYFTAYDCGMFVIATAEHLCKELCEGYSIPLVELVTQKTVTEGRQKIKDLIHQTAKDYSGS